MPSVAVLIPVLARPHRVGPLVDSIADTEPRARPLFIVSPGDDAEFRAVKASDADFVVVRWPSGQGDYARKMNHGFELTSDEWVFLGADDLVFKPGWFEEALKVHEQTSACVVGTNDAGNAKVMRGDHATHSLVHRDYGECGVIDDSSVILHTGYWHNWVDNEFVETAMWRSTFAPARLSVVEHLHPFWKKGRDDKTYEKGREHFADDRRHYLGRSRMWSR